jgi:NADPH:quinone reductase-like Zn-dependent oxidoreductase
MADRGYVYDGWGGPERLRVAELPAAEPAANAVLIAVEYAGVNPADAKVLSGKYRLICRGGFPRRAGIEGAGTVVRAAAGVQRLRTGMRVAFGLNPIDGRAGSWSESVVVDAGSVYPVPDDIPLRDAAVLPVAALTAWQMCRMTGIGAGSRVLITGASGGVGSFAVQIANALGAVVAATAGERNRALVLSLGADEFADYPRTPSGKLSGRCDVILDCVNAISRATARSLLTPGGRYVDTDPKPLTLLADRLRSRLSDRHYATVMVGPDADGMARLFDWIRQGQVKPLIAAEFAIEQVPQAVAAVLSGHSVGKNVVRIV